MPAGEEGIDLSGPREAIALYDQILERYPYYEHNDLVLYQKARAYDELGEPEAAMAVMDRLVDEYPASRHADEHASHTRSVDPACVSIQESPPLRDGCCAAPGATRHRCLP